MKVISIVLAVVLCSTVYGDYVAKQTYDGTGCTGSPWYYQVGGMKIGTCYKDGALSKKVKEDDLKTYIYASTDCSGSGTAGSTTRPTTCTDSGTTESYKYAKITESEFNSVGIGGLQYTSYTGSDACAASEDKRSYLIYTSAYVAACHKQGTGSVKATVSAEKFTSKTYTSTDCSGTATETTVDINKCTNSTSGSPKKSNKYTIPDALSSASMIVNSITAILFALIVGMNLSQ